MNRMTPTALFCVTVMIVIAIYDAIAVSVGGIDASVSHWLQSTAFGSPAFSVAMGFIAGHFWGYMKPKTLQVFSIETIDGEPKELRYIYATDLMAAIEWYEAINDDRIRFAKEFPVESIEVEKKREPCFPHGDLLKLFGLIALAAILTAFMYWK